VKALLSKAEQVLTLALLEKAKLRFARHIKAYALLYTACGSSKASSCFT